MSRIRTKHCVDMSLRARTLASINKTQIYCYFFNQQAANQSSSANEESWQPHPQQQSKNADLPEDSDMDAANDDYLEGGDPMSID